jgi:hypothetical protein
MTDASLALRTALVQALSSDGAVTSALGGAKIYDDVPQKSAFPYVVVGQSRWRDWSTGSDEGAEHALVLHVWSRKHGRKEAETIIEAVRTALHDQPLTLMDHHLVNLRLEDADVRRDGDTYHGVMTFRAVTEAIG